MGARTTAFLSHATKALAASKVHTDHASRTRAARDESDIEPILPVAVCTPYTHDDVVELVRLAREFRVPLFPRGGGSGLEGGAIPSPSGVVVDLTRMNGVLEVRPMDRFVRVQPGMVYARLNRLMAQHGLFFPSSPGGSAEIATIGGMVSTNASGTLANMYGGTGNFVRYLKVVTGTARTVEVGACVSKASEGPEMVHVFVGAQGTLGIITEVGLALAPLPETRLRRGYVFADERSALQSAIQIAAYVTAVAGLEFLGQEVSALLASAHDPSLPHGTLVLVEAHGQRQECEHALSTCDEIAKDQGGSTVDQGTVERLFALRERVTGTIREQKGAVVRSDPAVPLAEALSFVQALRQLAREQGAELFLFGHVGVGIFHVLFPVAPEERDAALGLKTRVMKLALQHSGALTGEHGIGLLERELLARARPGTAMLWRALKRALDPDGILNPGKLLPLP